MSIFKHREIRQRIGADQRGLELLAIRQTHRDPGRPAGDVVVGQNVAVRGNDRARAAAPAFLHPPGPALFGDHVDPDQRRIDRLHGGLDLRVGLGEALG